MKISDYIVNENETIINAMEKIDNNAKGIVFICENQKLIASLTDGDIRRYMLKNGNLSETVIKIANRNPSFLYKTEKKNIAQYMDKLCIDALPIVNENGEIVEIKFLRDRVVQKDKKLQIPVVIMAGGKGERLKPYTNILPKPLIPIGEQTITEHIMDNFEKFGCNNFDMIINYKKNLIKAYFVDCEVKRNLSFTEEEKFLGTGGGLQLIESKYKSTFFLTNCDILVDADYEEIYNYHVKSKNIITMVCANKKVIIPYGSVKCKNEKVYLLEEKPTYEFQANTGLYLIEPEFLHKIPKDTFVDITDIIQLCLKQGDRVGMFPIDDSLWLDMGQFNELEKMKERLE